MNSNFGDAVVSTPQSRNRLENRESKNDKVSRRVWKTVETSAREVGLGETEGERSKKGSRKKIERKIKKEKAEERKNGRSKEGG